MSRNLTDIVLLLANFKGIANLDAAWLGNLSGKPAPPILCLEFGKNMFSLEGWVGGLSPDTDTADLQLATHNRTGVSKRHFQIDIHPMTCHPRVTVLSRSLRLETDGKRLHLTQKDDIEILSSAIFDLGGTEFYAWRPKLTTAGREEYRQKALAYCREAVLALPKYFPPLKSAPETITSNVRYGPNEKVYVYQGYSGRGASASVMLVQERKSGKIFAAKEPYYKVSDDPGIRKSRWEVLNKEYEYLYSLDHPHIVKVHDIVLAQDEKEPAWMIEDYISGCLSPKKLDQQSTIVVATQLLSALAYIHSVDIVHRDVKPGNILMEGNTAILGDFGAAQHRVHGKLDTFTGTPGYLAPEFLEQPRNYTNKVDMFSCGMILLECLSTWDPQSNSEWLSNQLNRRLHKEWMRQAVLPCIMELPDSLRPLLRGLLRRVPEKRWSALKCLAWLAKYAEAFGNGPYSHASPRDQRPSNPETNQPYEVVTPERLSCEGKRPASAALSDGIKRRKPPPREVFGSPRQLQFGEELPLSPMLREPAIELPSTLASGAPSVPPPDPLQPPVMDGPPSDLASTLSPRDPFVTPPPPSLRFGTAISPNHGLSSYLPNNHAKGSLPDPPPQSPSWAPTPYQDEGEFPISRKDNEYSAEETDHELLRDWDESEGEDKD